MRAIDADAHVEEAEETFSYMEESEHRFKPVSMELSEGNAWTDGNAKDDKVWIFNGSARLRRTRSDSVTHTTRETRELLDIEARLQHMDELGIDVQVLFPTTFLHAFTTRSAVELAVYKSYNRWLADRCSLSHGRLRWACLIPTMSPHEAVDELRFAKDHGACCVLKKGIELDEQAASSPYFFPIYEEAERLDLPICFHSATSNPTVSNIADAARTSVLNVISACSSLAEFQVPRMFPNLRWGFIEAGASWIPYVIKDRGMRGKAAKAPFDWKTGFLGANNFYVTCDTEDDIPNLLQYGSEDYFMIGTDYGHSDQAAEINAHQVLMGRVEKGELPAVAAQKIIEDNARRFYAL